MSRSVRDYTERITTQVIPIDLIDPHESNYNFHPETQLSDLEQSYERRGQFLSKLVWARPGGRYTLVIGEGFTAGAKRGGAEALRCEVLPEDTPPEYVREILLADNLHARNSVPDEDVLARLLKEQQMAGVSLASLGSDEEELRQLLEAAGEAFEGDGYSEGAGGDDFDTTPEEGPTRTHLGELWKMGEHRLLIADSSDEVSMHRLIGNESIEAIVTDPPYAFGLASMSNMHTKSGGWHDMMNNASWFTDRYHQWRRLVRNGPLWVFCNWRTLPILMRAGFDSGVGLNNVMVWYKDWIGPGGTKGLRPTYELIGFSALGEYTISDRGVEDFIKVGWSSHKPSGHQAEKPVDLIVHLLDTSQCSTIYDPFAGSGTLVIAAQRTDRTAYVCEIDPKWADVIIARWEAETGQTAQLITQEALLSRKDISMRLFERRKQ